MENKAMTNKPDTEQQTATQVNQERYLRHLAMRKAFAMSMDKRTTPGIAKDIEWFHEEGWQAAIASVQPEIDLLTNELATYKAYTYQDDYLRVLEELAEVKAQRDRLLELIVDLGSLPTNEDIYCVYMSLRNYKAEIESPKDGESIS